MVTCFPTLFNPKPPWMSTKEMVEGKGQGFKVGPNLDLATSPFLPLPLFALTPFFFGLDRIRLG